MYHTRTKQKVDVKIHLIRRFRELCMIQDLRTCLGYLGRSHFNKYFSAKMDLRTNIFAGYFHDVSVLFEK